MSEVVELRPLQVPPRDDRRSWLEWRRKGIGGSDAAAVCGLSPFATPMGLWLEKTGRLPLEGEPSAAMEWGLRLEDAVVRAFEDASGYSVSLRQTLVTHPEHDFMRATVDGFVSEPDILAIFEGKTAGSFEQGWSPVARGEIGEADGVPIHYQLQVQHVLAVTGLQRGWLAVLIGGQDFRVYELERDEVAIAKLVERERRFWLEHVLADVAPPADPDPRTSQALAAAFAEPEKERSVELPGEALDLVFQRKQARAEEKVLAQQAEAAENALKAMLGEAEVGLYEGEEIVSWRAYERQTLDLDGLRKRLSRRTIDRFTRTLTHRRLAFPKEVPT